jgi:hypothetical protein
VAKKSKNFTIFINHHICPIFHAEIDLSKLQLNFAHFIGPILTLHGPTSFKVGTKPGVIQVGLLEQQLSLLSTALCLPQLFLQMN